jgi:hypothetical protein
VYRPKVGIDTECLLIRVAKGTKSFSEIGDEPYNNTIGPLVFISDEEIDQLHSEGEDFSNRILSAYYDYMGKFFMLFTGDGHSFQLPMSFFAETISPEDLRITNRGLYVWFGSKITYASAELLRLIHDEEKRKKEIV